MTTSSLPGGLKPYSSFRYWLRDQRHRNDVVGDLARDVCADPRKPHYRSLPQWVEYIGGEGSIAYRSLVHAWREFARVAKSRPKHRRSPMQEHRGLRRRSRAITPSIRARIFARDQFRCRRCGSGPQHARLVVDHIMPVARGGSDDEWNLQTLCDPCNQGKADNLPHPHDLGLLR